MRLPLEMAPEADSVILDGSTCPGWFQQAFWIEAISDPGGTISIEPLFPPSSEPWCQTKTDNDDAATEHPHDL
jgi:hypothetical protein